MSLPSPMITAFIGELTKLAKGPKYLENLKPGDVISIEMTRPTKGTSLIDRAFGKGTQAVQGSYTHTGIYVGKGKMVESRIGEGVTKKNFGKALRNHSFIVHRPRVSHRQRRHASQFAQKQVGKKYDSLALVATAAGTVLPSAATRLIDQKVFKAPKNSDKFTCSNLITASYAKAHLSDAGNRLATPVGLRKSKKMKVVMSVQKRGFKEKAPILPTTRWGWRKRERVSPQRLIKR